MKILFCKNNFAGPISGADEIAVIYAIELKAAGHDPSILLVHAPSKRDPLALRLREGGIPLNTLASPAFSSSLETARKLAIRAMHTFSPASRLIRSNSRKIVADLLQRYHNACCKYLELHRPDLVHVLTPGPGAEMLIRAAHDTNIPIIYQEVGIPFHPPGFEEVYERFVNVLPLCTGLAALSPCLAEGLKEALPNIHTAHVLPLISPDQNGVSSNNSTPEEVTFGFAARLEHLKGPLRLLEAFNMVHKSYAEIRLKIAGEGSQQDDFISISRKFGLEEKCELLGVYTTLEERSRFMTGIDVLVLPSLTEGTPNVIIEAMAHARPIIGTAVGGVPDLVSEDVGILVPADDGKALAGAMTRLAGDSDLRRRMGLAARKKYEQLFTPRAVLPVLLDFYEQVIRRHAINNGGGEKSMIRQQQLSKDHPWFVSAERRAGKSA